MKFLAILGATILVLVGFCKGTLGNGINKEKGSSSSGVEPVQACCKNANGEAIDGEFSLKRFGGAAARTIACLTLLCQLSTVEAKKKFENGHTYIVCGRAGPLLLLVVPSIIGGIIGGGIGFYKEFQECNRLNEMGIQQESAPQHCGTCQICRKACIGTMLGIAAGIISTIVTTKTLCSKHNT